MPGLQGFRGWGFFSQKAKVSLVCHLNTCKCNVFGLKLETKVMPSHKIQVEKISLFLLNMYAVHDF